MEFNSGFKGLKKDNWLQDYVCAPVISVAIGHNFFVRFVSCEAFC